MIDRQTNCLSNCCLCNIMEQSCTRQCIRRTLYAVIVGVSPVVICLLFIGVVRLILYRLELAYHRRQKTSDRHASLVTYQSGRLALSYTPVSNAEIQRIIQGDYQSQSSNELLPAPHASNNSVTRKTPKFIKSILPRREPSTPLSSSILANLVIRRDITDPLPVTTALAPVETPLQPTFSVINEQDKRRRPSVITITRESVETTTTLAAVKNTSSENSSNTIDSMDSDRMKTDPFIATTKTMTTTTVVVEEFLDFHSVSSLPCVLSLLDSVIDKDNDQNLETNKDQEEDK